MSTAEAAVLPGTGPRQATRRDAAQAHADFFMVQLTARVAVAVKAAQTWLTL
jgi:hypothetical protein